MGPYLHRAWNTSHIRPNTTRRDVSTQVARAEHGRGINPVYRDRCIAHASEVLGPNLAYLDADTKERHRKA